MTRHRIRWHLAAVLIGALASLVTPSVRAQVVPPDEVRTTDGGLVRGVIVENVPGDHLIILLPNGDTRRISAAEIASTATVAPSASATPAAVPAAPVFSGARAGGTPPVVGRGALRIDVVSESPGLTLHGSAAGTYTNRICYEACELHLDRGNYQFVVQDARSRMRAVPGVVMLNGDGELRIGVRSRRVGRTVMVVTGIILSALAVPAFIGPNARSCDEFGLCMIDAAHIGIGSGLAGAGFGLLMATMRLGDVGVATYRPYDSSVPAPATP